ncbi:ABC transporter ATP-binding protein [Mangrovimonas sp. DI 80]|uniref:ABC transporter ATP-binding protein n=1 Tax=Mangrovimonas sp. DI 80 TaxID=1779330 RepID=UPI0009763DC5|nr:ABC transporter ATP-binding protein [Mangrovimonas sp. DI 80]OMP32390.1 ABC transporter ATP-binding protein [Mangrovimonas sp. DI 80]
MLQVKNLSFHYKDNSVLKDVNFEVGIGEHLSIIGESGSGKSTLLKLLYGEHDLDQGEIFWKNIQILGPKFNLVIGYDFMKYVAQEFDLMPFTSVEENIGKFLSNFYPEEKQERIAELLEVVELTHFAKTKVKTLSGGQKQRVALARALAKQPEIMLLDEPFSHIDNFKKQSLRRNVFQYLKQHKITCIVATHDSEDVLGFSDRMIVLDKHQIVGNDSPENLFNNPQTPLIASFFGEFNIIEGNIVYAHQLKVVPNSNLKATVKQAYFKGACYLIEGNLGGKTIFFEHFEELKPGTLTFLEYSK